MSGKPDFRDLIIDHPACRASVQAEHMDGTVYTEFEPWLRSMRKGNVARVFRPFLLGGGKGATAKQRKIWVERAKKVKAKGATLVSIQPALTGADLTMFASVEITNVKRGRAGKPKKGRTPKTFTDVQWAHIHKHWPRRTGVTVEAAVTAINKAIWPRKVSAGWLYTNVKGT